MSTLQTLPNNTSGQRLFMQHELEVPACCCVSGNPRPGSIITICYRARVQVLEVASVYVYLHRFVHGLRDSQGNLLIRDMESMLCRIASDCAQVLGVPVRVKPNWTLVPHQRARAIFRGYPLMEEERIEQL